MTTTAPASSLKTVLRRLHPKARSISAVQFTGHESVPAIQDFLAQDSPLFDAREEKSTLGVYLRDRRQEALYPSLGRQHSLVFAHVGDWIVRQADGELRVLTDQELRDFYDVPEESEAVVPPPAPLVPESAVAAAVDDDDIPI